MKIPFFNSKPKETPEDKRKREAKVWAATIVDSTIAKEMIIRLDEQIFALSNEISKESLNASMMPGQSYGDDIFGPGAGFEQQAMQAAIDQKENQLEVLVANRNALQTRMYELKSEGK